MLLHLRPNVITFRTLLHLGPNVITFRTLLHLGPNVITFRTLLHLGQLLHLGLQHTFPSIRQPSQEGCLLRPNINIKARFTISITYIYCLYNKMKITRSKI